MKFSGNPHLSGNLNILVINAQNTKLIGLWVFLVAKQTLVFAKPLLDEKKLFYPKIFWPSPHWSLNHIWYRPNVDTSETESSFFRKKVHFLWLSWLFYLEFCYHFTFDNNFIFSAVVEPRKKRKIPRNLFILKKFIFPRVAVYQKFCEWKIFYWKFPLILLISAVSVVPVVQLKMIYCTK